MRGFVLVISSPGKAYARMEAAWLRNWERQHIHGLCLLVLRMGPRKTLVPLGAPSSWMLTVEGQDSLVPGILEKTKAGMHLAQLWAPQAWIFRTNLSSHVDLPNLNALMSNLPEGSCAGFSPARDHLCGAGIGMTAAAAAGLLASWHQLDHDAIDDLAMSGYLLAREVRWTGRLDRVWPDGLVRHGSGPYYHVRVKTRDRTEDADILEKLAGEGIASALAWFS